jgi:hypothetical protein
VDLPSGSWPALSALKTAKLSSGEANALDATDSQGADAVVAETASAVQVVPRPRLCRDASHGTSCVAYTLHPSMKRRHIMGAPGERALGLACHLLVPRSVDVCLRGGLRETIAGSSNQNQGQLFSRVSHCLTQCRSRWANRVCGSEVEDALALQTIVCKMCYAKCFFID